LRLFHAGLKQSGYVEGQNVAVEYRFAEGHFDRYPALAADLLRHGVAVLVALNNDAALAAKRATATTPIIFGMGGDPVALGLVASLSRPSDNITGIYFFTQGLEAKRCLK
jgi:putative ABC transport system substrate-binding protein